MINIFIGPTVRSGGSLLNRLFDHHPDVAAYPFELFFTYGIFFTSLIKNAWAKVECPKLPIT